MRHRYSVLIGFLIAVSATSLVWGQDGDAIDDQTGKPPVAIAEEPRTIDPSQFVPDLLAKPTTVDLTNSSLRELVRWMEETLNLPVVLDEGQLKKKGITAGSPIQESLNDQPLYLLLNRLDRTHLGWSLRNGILYLSTVEATEEEMTARTFNVGNLVDDGYEIEELILTIQQGTTHPWEEQDGYGGTLDSIGDVIFVRNTPAAIRQVAGLLAALESPARMTYAYTPREDVALFDRLKQPIDVRFDEAPLVDAMTEIADLSKVEIRFDPIWLRSSGFQDREPVSLNVQQQSLRTVLDLLLEKLPGDLGWQIENGVLWISGSAWVHSQSTAVFDVRDLCRDWDESYALLDALYSQSGGHWIEVGGNGGNALFPKAGILVTRNSDPDLLEVDQLLGKFREALLHSKRRPERDVDEEEFITRYYRLESEVAESLKRFLPSLLEKEAWEKVEKFEDGMLLLASTSDQRPHQISADGVSKKEAAPSSQRITVSMSVLVIHQPRRVHREIERVITFVQSGNAGSLDGLPVHGLGGGGSGGQAGGFGGGFFSVQPK